jgi:hypothetical protein
VKRKQEPQHVRRAKDAHGYVMDCLWTWGRQRNDVRSFSRAATGFYSTSSSVFKKVRPRRDAGNTEEIDGFYASLEPDQRRVMMQRFRYGQEMKTSQAAEADILGMTPRVYRRILQEVIDLAWDFILKPRQKNAPESGG